MWSTHVKGINVYEWIQMRFMSFHILCTCAYSFKLHNANSRRDASSSLIMMRAKSRIPRLDKKNDLDSVTSSRVTCLLEVRLGDHFKTIDNSMGPTNETRKENWEKKNEEKMDEMSACKASIKLITLWDNSSFPSTVFLHVLLLISVFSILISAAIVQCTLPEDRRETLTMNKRRT